MTLLWTRSQPERLSDLISRQCCRPASIEIREPLLCDATVVGGSAG